MKTKTIFSVAIVFVFLLAGSYIFVRASSLGILYNIDGQNDGVLSAASDNYVLMSSTTAPSGFAWRDPNTVLPPRVFSTSTRSIVTGTGATGFQVSATRDAIVNYAVNIQTTATIGGSSAGYVTLEVSPTNSASAASWYEIGSRCRNDQTITLAIALQSVQSIGCSLPGTIPAGYYTKIRSVNVGGTPTYTFISGEEIQL